MFVGQGASHARTITQKEQIAIMNDFRKGVCNTLIATCVAEEGIDVGEVDLIICFDVNNRNPTRYVQRIGRTGRRRQGKVIMLVTEGKEQNILRDIMATKDGTNQKISKSNDVSNALYREAPRLVPPEFNPQCTEMFIKIEDNNNTIADEDDDRPNAKKTKKKVCKSLNIFFCIFSKLFGIQFFRQQKQLNDLLKKGFNHREPQKWPMFDSFFNLLN